MRFRSNRIVLNRRQVVIGVSAGVITATAAPLLAEQLTEEPAAKAPLARQGSEAHSQQYVEALKAILKDAQPRSGALSLELPDLAENGNVVPYKITAESPMTDTDYVRTLYLLSTANPQALVATFHLVPANGLAAVAGRMRLAKSQEVVVLAELSDDTFLLTSRKIEVTIGGCGNE